MTRIAVLGANGQVGAELCLLLHAVPGVQLVPVCRSRQGSAFLRSHGVACRHGALTDAEQAKRLIGDCELIVNLVLMPTTTDPAGARRAMATLIEHVSRVAAGRARHLFLSTMSVYGDREIGAHWALRNSYGQDKHHAERLALRAGRRHGCATTIFRLGHVCGELQGLTRQIREQLRRGPVPVPDPDRASNTTQVAAIAQAVLEVAAGRVAPGSYDLMNTPQWSWREVYAHEAAVIGMPLEIETVGDPPRAGLGAFARSLLGAGVALLQGHALLRRLASRALLWLPAALYRRLRVWHALRSAAAELRTLRTPREVLDATRRAPLPLRAAPNLANTAALLAAPPWVSRAPAAPWPPDLADATDATDARALLGRECRA